MALASWFRLCFYATLGLSCTALVYAETSFLPALPGCLPPVLALLVLGWWVEGRWSLPAWGVNVLAALIAAGAVAWVMMQLSDEASWASQVPIRLALVPYSGPLLMAALLVKVFQARRPGDFWRIQGLGLAQVGLGCVLAEGPGFGGILAGYLAGALACLALHYRLFAARDPQPAARTAAGGGRRTEGGWWLARFTTRWALLVGALALLLFLLTPRPDTSTWQPFHSARAEMRPSTRGPSGTGDEINLNGVGRVELDDEVALQVAASDDAGLPQVDLPADQRWRGGVLDWYEQGKWTTTQRVTGPARGRSQRELPDFGPGQYFLTFTTQPRQAGGLVLADPVHFGPPPTPLPVLALPGAERPPIFFEVGGSILPVFFSSRQQYHYRQVVPPHADPERTSARGLRAGSYPERLTRQSVPGMSEWTINLLRRLSDRPAYALPDAVRADLTGPAHSFLVEPEHWEAVARALTRYLAESGEFSYTLELTRSDLSVDPVMDFLLNLRRGHCERYATALALMLRSVGIPSRVVKGYRGADNQGDGTYLIRHHHAHAWVEILVPPREPRGAPFDWLTLDPTPGQSAESETSFSLSYWWEEGRRSALQLWQTLIVDYNADEQAELVDLLSNGRGRALLRRVGLPVLAVLSALVVLVLLRRLRRRRAVRSCPTAPAFYVRLLALLARHGSLRPRFGQTPREFGEAARQLLLQRPGLATLADVPGRVVERLYQVRFGGRPLEEAEGRALDAELDRLAEALRHTPHLAGPQA